MTHALPSKRMSKRRSRLIERDGWVHAFNWQNRPGTTKETCGCVKTAFLRVDRNFVSLRIIFRRFVQALDVLRELIVKAIHKDDAP
jgi:hypothetical protein